MTEHLPAPAPDDSGEFILYQTEHGQTRIEVRMAHETVWLTQRDMADLFQTTPQNITQHIAAVYDEGELAEVATCKEFLQVRSEGARQVERSLKHYNLDVIISVGDRVRSHRGTQFRIWATERLREYLIKASNDWTVNSLGELAVNLDSIRVPVKEAERKPGPYPYYGCSCRTSSLPISASATGKRSRKRLGQKSACGRSSMRRAGAHSRIVMGRGGTIAMNSLTIETGPGELDDLSSAFCRAVLPARLRAEIRTHRLVILL